MSVFVPGTRSCSLLRTHKPNIQLSIIAQESTESYLASTLACLITWTFVHLCWPSKFAIGPYGPYKASACALAVNTKQNGIPSLLENVLLAGKYNRTPISCGPSSADDPLEVEEPEDNGLLANWILERIADSYTRQFWGSSLNPARARRRSGGGGEEGRLRG
jgi:hypothetical protein